MGDVKKLEFFHVTNFFHPRGNGNFALCGNTDITHSVQELGANRVEHVSGFDTACLTDEAAQLIDVFYGCQLPVSI